MFFNTLNLQGFLGGSATANYSNTELNHIFELYTIL